MKKITLLLVAALFSSAVFAQYLTLKEILDGYYKVNNVEKMKEVNTVIVKGSSTNMGQTFPFTIYKKRPDKFRLEVPIQGTSMLQIYNGDKGWIVTPWTSNPLKEMTAKQLTGFKKETDFEGPLYNWKQKGNKVVLMSKEKMGDTDVYQLKLTSKDSSVTYYYIDAKKFVLLKTKSVKNIKGQHVETEKIFSDYRKDGDFLFAHSIKVLSGGHVNQTMEITSVKYDAPVDDKLFDKPKVPETPGVYNGK
jgi:hypothetical protein